MLVVGIYHVCDLVPERHRLSVVLWVETLKVMVDSSVGS